MKPHSSPQEKAEKVKGEAITVPPRISRKRSFIKAISWRAIGTLDTLLLSFFVLSFLGPVFGMEATSHGENAKTATLIALTEVATKVVLYYVHERFWEQFKWGTKAGKDGVRSDQSRRSGVKTATWRVTASTDTMLLAWLFTGNIGTAISIGGIEAITKLALYTNAH